MYFGHMVLMLVACWLKDYIHERLRIIRQEGWHVLYDVDSEDLSFYDDVRHQPAALGFHINKIHHSAIYTLVMMMHLAGLERQIELLECLHHLYI